MEAQQFHLKWNNHSLNTLSSFQQLLDTNTLVDVSLTCSNGKTVTAHRMVLAACSDYFYHLFKDLPERHPVIVFKDAGEEIVRDLLLFMYKGEVEVQEVYLNDFLKFADTLQVKGLSQSDRDGSPSAHNIPSTRHNPSNAAQDLSPTATSNTSQPSITKDVSSKPIKAGTNNGGRRSATSTPKMSSEGEQAIPLIKGNNNNNTSTGSSPLLPSSLPGTPVPNPLGAQDLAKSYLASLSKFPSLFPLAVPPPTSSDPTTPPPSGQRSNPLGLPPTGNFSADLLSHLSSPNLYRALQRKYPENPVLLQQMPFFKKMFGDNAELAATAAAAMYPHVPPLPTSNRDDNDNDSIAERSPPTTPVPPPAINLPGLPGMHLPPHLPGVHLPTTIHGLMRPSLPLTPLGPAGLDGENGFPDRGNNSSPMDSDSPYPPSSGAGSIAAELNSTNGSISSPTKSSSILKSGDVDNEDNKKDDRSSEGGDSKHVRGSKGGSAGRGSRLERMIAAEYKIMSEYSETQPNPESLPVMTPELMKSRRTHSLQLAIAEIMHNRASVQSAATKYHIPRETLRRHYQRYLKTMGIQRAPGTNGPVKGATGTTATAVAAATNNNAAKGQVHSIPSGLSLPSSEGSEQHAVTSLSQGANSMIPTSIMQSLAGGMGGGTPTLSIPGDGRGPNEANCFSSLMEIGQAYGIWSPEVLNKDNHNNKDKHDDDDENMDEDDKETNDKDKDDGLVIDERDDDDEDVEVDDDEPLSPGGPEDEQPIPVKPSTRTSSSSQIDAVDSSPSSSSSVTKSAAPASSVGTAASNSISKAPMETSA